jgi:hypothetical protein
MHLPQVAAMALFISVILGVMGLSHKLVENFLFLEQTADKLPVNPNILQHSILVPVGADAADKINEDLVHKLCSKNESLIKNILKYGDVSKWSAWIQPLDKIEQHIDEINRQFFYYIKKKLTGLDVILCKLNKYRYATDAYNDVLLDYDIVCHNKSAKCGWHIKTLCAINIDSKRVHFLDIRLAGTISEDKLYGTGAGDTDAQTISDGQLKLVDNDLMYQDNCLSMKTQDLQLHQLMYNKLMYIPDEADEQNKQYAENQKMIKKLLLNKLTQHSEKGGPAATLKSYPYDDDFKLKFT